MNITALKEPLKAKQALYATSIKVKKFALTTSILLIFLTLPSFAEFLESSGTFFKKSKDHKAMMPTKTIRKIPLPKGGYHEGLLLEGGNIWINNGEKKNTWVIDLKTGKKIREIIPPGTFTEGITHAPGGKYWVTDWDTKKLYLVNIKDNKMIPETEISLAPSYPTGVVWNGTHLYVIIWTRGIGTKYHLLKFDKDGKLLLKAKMQGIQEPSQITWDGKYLWITSWFNRRVYKIDPETLERKGYFRSLIENTTGIAWDGKYFWVTGTKEPLRQIKLLSK